MTRYSDFIDRMFLHEELLKKLHPTEVFDVEWLHRIRDANDDTLSGGKKVGNARLFALVRGGLFYAIDALPDCHAIFQEDGTELGAYWHGMMHRREADFDNARYWFRRAGELPCFGEMHERAANASADMAKQMTWSPYLVTSQMEQARFGAGELVDEMVALQRAEFDVFFDYCWRRAAVSKSEG